MCFSGERGGKFKDGTIESHNTNFAGFMRLPQVFSQILTVLVCNEQPTYCVCKKLLF